MSRGGLAVHEGVCFSPPHGRETRLLWNNGGWVSTIARTAGAHNRGKPLVSRCPTLARWDAGTGEGVGFDLRVRASAACERACEMTDAHESRPCAALEVRPPSRLPTVRYGALGPPTRHEYPTRGRSMYAMRCVTNGVTRCPATAPSGRDSLLPHAEGSILRLRDPSSSGRRGAYCNGSKCTS